MRILSLCIMLAATFAFVAGCGEDDSKTTKSTKTETSKVVSKTDGKTISEKATETTTKTTETKTPAPPK